MTVWIGQQTCNDKFLSSFFIHLLLRMYVMTVWRLCEMWAELNIMHATTVNSQWRVCIPCSFRDLAMASDWEGQALRPYLFWFPLPGLATRCFAFTKLAVRCVGCVWAWPLPSLYTEDLRERGAKGVDHSNGAQTLLFYCSGPYGRCRP
jgi:hypothetical protein